MSALALISGGTEPPKPTTPVPARVLYVDDDPDALGTFRRVMRRRGFEVDTAGGAAQALKLAATTRYAVVATDLDMPDTNGVELISALHDLDATLSFVLVTGAASARQLTLPTDSPSARAIACVIHKPWKADDIENALRRSIELHHSRVLSEAEAAVVSASCVRVLLVEDNHIDAILMKGFLSSVPDGHYSLVQVQRLSEAVELLECEAFDVIITDLSLPDARGIDAVSCLQALAPAVPIIVVSGQGDEDIALQAVQLGAQDYIVKGRTDRDSLHRSLNYAIERKRSEERLAHLAHHDQLTELANRTLFHERVCQSIGRAKRQQSTPALLLLDLDRFKIVNDTRGHDAGDALLIHVAKTLIRAVREVDTVARLGGDEFAVLLDDVVDEASAGDVAARILGALDVSSILAEDSLAVTASIGIAVFPQNGETPEHLLKSADCAMYRAKECGRNNYQFFDREIHERAALRMELERDLRGALERDEFEVYYQPQNTVSEDYTVSVEALLRWNHPRLGRVGPDQFIPLLEDSGHIVEVGEWVCQQACAQIQSWQQSCGKTVRIAVNVSPRQFDDPEFAAKVRRALAVSGVEPTLLELEITERLLVRDLDAAAITMQALKDVGVRMAMDDFGTGYSPLAYLVRFPLDVLKIDRSVVSSIGDGHGNSVVTAVIELAHSLGLEVIAEGVEETTQLDFLRERDCDMFQGFLRAAPMTSAACEVFLRDQPAEPDEPAQPAQPAADEPECD